MTDVKICDIFQNLKTLSLGAVVWYALQVISQRILGNATILNIYFLSVFFYA